MRVNTSLNDQIKANPKVVVLDASVLVGAFHRNFLLSFAEVGLFVPIWSNKILDEVEKAISKLTSNQNEGRRQRIKISKTFPDSIVQNFSWRELGIDLPDENDKHVMAVGLKSFAKIIVTNNLNDFPSDYLARISTQCSKL